MPDRVVTADLEALLGVPVLACVAVPYRDQGVPAKLRGGSFLDILAVLPAGTANAASLHPFVYEATGGMPQRLRNEAGGAQHEIWGWTKRTDPLSPDDDASVIAGVRVAPLSFDLGAHLNAKVLRARAMPVLGSKRAYELLVEDSVDPLNNPGEHIYDTLDAHPANLREIAESSGYVRRESASDAAPTWEQRKVVP